MVKCWHISKVCGTQRMLLANTEQVRAGLEHMSREPALPHILQPLAKLAASKCHAEILQLCVDKGIIFDQHLDAGIRAGTTQPAMLEVIWRETGKISRTPSIR